MVTLGHVTWFHVTLMFCALMLVYVDCMLNVDILPSRPGRYRVFFDIARQRGAFPRALNHSAIRQTERNLPQQVTVWCDNDYLGMGQHPVVLNAMASALD